MTTFDERKETGTIAVYGADDHLRLHGAAATQSIDKFSYGVADQGRLDLRGSHLVQDGYRGYLEQGGARPTLRRAIRTGSPAACPPDSVRLVRQP